MNKKLKNVIILLSIIIFILAIVLIILINSSSNNHSTNNNNNNSISSNNNISIEYQDSSSIIKNYDKLGYSGNIIFTKQKLEDQVFILKNYKEYSEFQKKYINEMWLNGTEIKNGFEEDLGIAQENYDNDEAAIVIYYNSLDSYSTNLYQKNNLLYVNIKDNAPLTHQFKEQELNNYKSCAYLYFIDKQIVDQITKIVIVDEK